MQNALIRSFQDEMPQMQLHQFRFQPDLSEMRKTITPREQARLNLSPNKPNPPFFLAALIGVQDSPNYEISANENDIAFPGTPHEEFDAQELLIALDDLQTDNPKTDSLEPPDSGEDEILFELDPTPEDEESESGNRGSP